MDCLVLPVSMLRRRSAGSRLGYRPLSEEALGDGEPAERPAAVTVVVGKERREFLVDPFVLEENPFQVLINSARKRGTRKEKRVVLVDVDSILFEHMLWLMHNDSTCLFQLNLKDILDFYAQDF
ncbi:auxin-responsive protein SAUR77-like [Syzygium oleosum]|uniref:auxin-responsive protein SAUR77-like n=1 Tax=Syzygium oleosum TaxID=219896 RepID=UPI0011D1876B|nr:auxin-responsive protein SAUR77-like [Syzygium oleosum]